MTAWIEHIPLKKKEFSGSENCSFLFQHNNIFVMDNHRLALWCWQYYLNSINQKDNKFNFFHLDAHEDAKVDLSPSCWDEIQNISLQDYMSEKSDVGNYLKYRWDNYLPVFVHENQPLIRKSVFVTHQVGLLGFAHQRISSYGLLQEFPKLFVDELQWIINLDLDYFYPKELKENLLFDTQWIKTFFRQIKKQYDQGDIALITVALSPECCGSWENAEQVCSLFSEVFNVKVKI
jgi:hypothetical protein